MKEITIDGESEPLVELMNELIDICTQGVCFEIHRSIRLGHWELLETDNESDKSFDIVEEPGTDVFGQQPVKKQQECICPNCSRTLAAIRFAPHLEKCMGMGRNSSRIASKRLRGQGVDGEYNEENDVDYDWSFEYEKKSRKKRDKLTNSPKRSKIRKGTGEGGIGLSSLVTNGSSGSRPGTPCSTASGDIPTTIKVGPTLQVLEALSQEEKIALLTQTCGAISEHTGKMCTRTGRCVQHTDEQRKAVRELLLGDAEDVPWPPSMRVEGSSLDQDDIHVDVDGYEDIDGGSLLRELTPLSWEQDSNISTSSESMIIPPVPNSQSLQSSPSVTKSKKSKNRKTRSR